MIVAEVLGWAGAVALLAGYALISRDRITAGDGRYVALSLSGSAGLAPNGAVHAAWPSTALNLLWLVIGLTALRYRRSSGTNTNRP
jgi:hypothetical protein